MIGDFMDILDRLQQSSFRGKFHLSDKDIEYINEKGLEKIEEHAKDFIQKRLAPEVILNDGKQTPMRGHPVFIAQHATATCCRGCLYKWHHIASNKELSFAEQNYIVKIIMLWIQKEIRNRK
ncbi:MAG: DUF4186 domain-containing protein [Bacilli bacterium]|nr:DUF4186 domain-containing protein [Bacilli bacterium]